MRVFVAGGSGVLGLLLVSQLVARGYQVTATTTTEAKLGLLAELGATPPGRGREQVQEPVCRIVRQRAAEELLPTDGLTQHQATKSEAKTRRPDRL